MATKTETTNATTVGSTLNSTEDEEIKQLYGFTEVLDKTSPSDYSKHEEMYKTILSFTKASSVKTKTLAGSIIPRYFKFFPNLSDSAINSLMDLCEEEDVKLRVQAVRVFPQICKDNADVLPKVADVLGQLLQGESVTELDNVKQSLVSILKLNPNGVINALFNQILTRDDLQREKAIQFLKDKVQPLIFELFSKDEENQRNLADNIKKVLVDVTGDEFKFFMDILRKLPIYKGEKGKELLDIIAEQADLKSEFKPTDSENINRLITCVGMTVPFYRKGATGSKFQSYLAASVLPSFSQISEENKYKLLKALAEISPYVDPSDAKIVLPALHTLITSHVPDGKTTTEESKINFSYIECILYAFLQTSAKAPGNFNTFFGIVEFTGQPSDMANLSNQERLEDMLLRMNFLSVNTEKYIKQFTSLQKETDKEKQETRKAALAITRNLSEFSKILKNALSNKKSVQPNAVNNLNLSWVTPQGKKNKGEKRGRDNNNNNNNNKQNKNNNNNNNNNNNSAKRGRGGVYQAPSRDNSNNNNNNNRNNNNSNRGGSGGRGGFGGRGGRGGRGRGNRY